MELLLLSNSRSDRGYLVHALSKSSPSRAMHATCFRALRGVRGGYDTYEASVAEALSPAGLHVHSIHHERDPADAVRNADCMIVGGGNTFHLLHECRRTGVLAALAERARAGIVISDGAPAPISPARRFARPTTCR